MCAFPTRELTTKNVAVPEYAVRKPDRLVIPYVLSQVLYKSPNWAHLNVLATELEGDKMWVPRTESVSFTPLLLCTSGGYHVNLLRVRKASLLFRHRHTGSVHAIF